MWVATACAQPTPTTERDPNFVGQGRDCVVTWSVNAAGIPLVHSFKYGDFTYIGFDKAGNSYLRTTSRRRPIWSYHKGRAQELWEAPTDLMRPSPVPGGPSTAELSKQYAIAASAAEVDSFNGTVQFTPRPAGDTEFDPNFYGAGESRLFFWGGLDEGRPQIYSTTFGLMTYLGFDKATGISYIQSPLDKQIYSYNATIRGNPGQAVANAPTNLSQPPSKKLRLDAAAAEQLQTWQKSSGANKDPNFWGDGVDKYFEWMEGGDTGPRISPHHAGNAYYVGFDETTGITYLALGNSSVSYSTYKAGDGRPIPVQFSQSLNFQLHYLTSFLRCKDDRQILP
jgi:hypothetical protein